MPKDRTAEPGDPAIAHAVRAARAALTSNLRSLRAAAGLSQAQLAERAGLSVVYVTALEGLRGQNPTLAALAALAHGLGCSPSALLGAAGRPARRPPGRPAASSRAPQGAKRRR